MLVFAIDSENWASPSSSESMVPHTFEKINAPPVDMNAPACAVRQRQTQRRQLLNQA